MPETSRRHWTREETLLAFRLYCRLPFGRLHKTNPEIIALARLLDRTPSAVGMKACNFASLDPHHRQRGVGGLGNSSALDHEVWTEFQTDPEAVAAEAEAAAERLAPPGESPSADVQTQPKITPIPIGDTESLRTVRVRRVQRFFRSAVLTSYGHRCALTGLAVPELLNASHIVPWAADAGRRTHPTNGVCLNALLDRAFDRGLITFDEQLRTIVSDRLKEQADPPWPLTGLEGKPLAPPTRWVPDPDALAWHRERVFTP